MKRILSCLKKSASFFIVLIALLGCQTKEAKEVLLSPRFNHVYLKVSDLDRSVAFYTAAFELKQEKQIKKLKRTSAEGVSEEFETSLSLLKFPGQDFVLEIGKALDFQSENKQANYSHIGIDVADIETASERILKAGGVMISPVTLVETEDIIAKNAFFTGPDGETLELMQLISGDF